MSARTEMLYQVLLVVAILAVAGGLLLGAVLLASRLTSARRSNLGAVLDFLSGKKTYLLSLIIVLNELYSSWQYDKPFNVTAILEALGLSTIRASIGSVQKTQAEVKDTTELVAATMPVAGAAPRSPEPVSPLPPLTASPKDVR